MNSTISDQRRNTRRWQGVICCVALGFGVSACSGHHSSNGPCSTTGTAPTDVKPARGGMIAFVAVRPPDKADLWMMRPDGSARVRLTAMPGGELEESWSPDGSQMAFTAVAPGSDPHNPIGAICVLTLGSDRLQTLTPTSVTDAGTPAWSPDGTKIAYVRVIHGDSQIFVANADGSDNRQITAGATGHDWPSWSPDSKKLAYTRSSDSQPDEIWVINADGRSEHLLQPRGMSGVGEEAWSPDGRSIAFISAVGNTESDNPVDWNEELFVMAADGTHVRRLTHTPGNDHWPPAWSPNGKRLAYTSDGVTQHSKIVVVNADGSQRTTIASQAPGEAMPAW